MKQGKFIHILIFLIFVFSIVFIQFNRINKQQNIIDGYEKKLSILNEEVGKYTCYYIEKLKGTLREIVYIDESWNSNVLENASKVIYNNRLLNENRYNIKKINEFIESIAFDLRVLAVTMNDNSISNRDKRMLLNVSINSRNLLKILENINITENEYTKSYDILESNKNLFDHIHLHKSFKDEKEIYLSSSYLNTIESNDENKTVGYTILLPESLDDFHWETYIENNNVVSLHKLSSSDIAGEDILIMKSDDLLKYRLELLDKGRTKIIFQYVNQNGEVKDSRTYDIEVN